MRIEARDAVSRPSAAVNEDLYGVIDGAAWILDGATGIADQRVLPGPSDARWLVEEVDTALREEACSSAAPSSVLHRVAGRTIAAFSRDALRRDAPVMDMPCAAFAMVRVRGDDIELSNLGDCLIIRRRPGGAISCFGTSKVTALDESLRQEVIRLQRQGVRHEEIWQRVLPLTRRNRSLMNRPDGYWTLSVSELGIDHVEVETFPAAEVDSLLLLTDGFYRLVDVYGRYTYATLFEAAHHAGLAALCAELRAIEAEDADCRRYPRLKVRDDATAVLITIARDG